MPCISSAFSSDSHGYDTRDYFKLDERLGTNDDFRDVCRALHDNGIRVVLDGVFNHVGRGFKQFRDVQEKREQSPYRDWFHIDFNGNSNYNDGFWYDGWEGHYELVRLNLRNEEVIGHIFEAVRYWVENFEIDGLRLDVAYCLDRDFLRRLRSFTDSLKPDFFLIGEILGGDYKTIIGDGLLHSATNYECYKGLYSSFNSMNMFEIIHSLIRHSGSDPGLCTGEAPASLWIIMMSPGRRRSCRIRIICLSCMRSASACPASPASIMEVNGEWKEIKGRRSDLRPCFEKPEWNALTDLISKMCRAKTGSDALCHGDFRSVLLTNRQCILRERQKRACSVAVNADEEEYVAHFNAGCGTAVDLITGRMHDFGGGSHLPPCSAAFWKMEK